MFQRPYQTSNNTAKDTDRDWSLVVTMATTIMGTKLVQSMVHWLMREFPSLLLGDFVIGWLCVFAGIFLLLLYSSLQVGVLDSPCAFITHLEVSVFFFPHFCNVATLASGPQTDSVRVRINWQRFCTGSFKLKPVDRLVATRSSPKKVEVWRILFEENENFSHKFEAVLPFGDFSPKKDRLIWTPTGQTCK